MDRRTVVRNHNANSILIDDIRVWRFFFLCMSSVIMLLPKNASLKLKGKAFTKITFRRWMAFFAFCPSRTMKANGFVGHINHFVASSDWFLVDSFLIAADEWVRSWPNGSMLCSLAVQCSIYHNRTGNLLVMRFTIRQTKKKTKSIRTRGLFVTIQLFIVWQLLSGVATAVVISPIFMNR